MKYLLALLLPCVAWALDPYSDVIGPDGAHYSSIPEAFGGWNNYVRSGLYLQHDWRQAINAPVHLTNVVDRTALPSWRDETNLLAQASAQLAIIQTNYPGVVTFRYIQRLPQAQISAITEGHLQAAIEAGDELRAKRIFQATIRLLAIREEAQVKGLDWRDPIVGVPLVTNVVTNMVWRPVQ